jgi:hypothetical protein
MAFEASGKRARQGIQRRRFFVPTSYEKIIRDNLREAFSRPLPELERSTGAEREGSSLTLRAFGEACRIDPEKVTLSGVPIVDPEGVLVSLYVRHAGLEEIQIKPFKSFKDFQGSMPYQGAFMANSEQALIPHITQIKKEAGAIKEAFGGADVAMGDFSLILYPLPKIALSYIFYLADEEFPDSAAILFSANALSFMPLDGLADVAEYTSKEMIRLVSR